MPENSKWLYTIPLNSSPADLAAVGGKGINLMRLSQANFPVPPGFILTTAAYREFFDTHQFAPRVQQTLQQAAQTGLDDPETLEAASASIRALFETADFLPGAADELRRRYVELGSPPVAVRSSATAEDLPELSFAGQQDTYLNVIGADELIRAVMRCWGSLWTARAIGYRARNGVDHLEAALAVVVQQMVDSRVSGVMFTVNPVSGLRSETVIDVVNGLGEGLVSGRVAPDHYVVDTASGRLVEKTLGAKAEAARPAPQGGVIWTAEATSDRQAPGDDLIQTLAEMGSRVAALYGAPQDIEWAEENGSIFLLQTRAVTSLFPVPAGMGADPLKVLFSFAAVQGVLDPITPMGRSMLSMLFAAGASLFGYRFTSETQTALYNAGERLWVNITGPVRNSLGRKVILAALGLVEPSVQQALRQVLDDPRLLPERQGIRLQTRMRLARFLFPLGYNMIRNWLTPEKRREVILMRSEDLLVRLQMRNAAISGDRFEKLAQLSALLPALVEEKLPAVFIRFVSGVAAGMASLNLLNVLSKDHFPSNAAGNGWHDRVMEVTRGLPNNPTTEMDLALWKVAQSIRHDAESSAAFEARTNAELAGQYLDGELPETAQRVLTAFLTQYGARGFCEIDAGRVRWREDPEHVIEVLRGYLQITSEDRAPDRVFQRSAEQAQDAVEALVAGVRSSRRGWLKTHLVRLAASRVRALLGMRESPKFFMVRMMGIERESLLACGREFAAAGELDQPDDLVYLSLTELQRFAARELFDWRGLIAQRRAAYQREFQRRQIPRLLLSDGRAYYGGMGVQPGDEANATLIGSPVSPGSVEGVVRVVFDPRQAHLLPGEILVCPGTDPSWTPLFLTAAGLVMEVGGMMTHGAVVAREYGIPAIVGVDRATRRLKTGQRVRVDGSTGQIILLS